MAKEVTCEILGDYGTLDIDENNSIKVVEVKWNGRQPKGYDIRRYSNETERLSKGITIPYDRIEDLINIFIENNLCNIEKIEEKIKKKKNSIFSKKDFKNMFNLMNEEMEKYTRDKYGLLRNSNNNIVISSRRKMLEV